MRKLLSLTRVLLKDLGSAFELKMGKKQNKWAGPLLWGFIGICMLPLMGIFFVLFQGFYALFEPMGELAFITGLTLNIASVVVLVFSVFSAPAIFYFSRDVEYLLPLPLKPTQIIGAKFIVALLTEYVVTLFILAPMYAAYVTHMPAVALTINTLLVFLTVPITPLVYSAVIVMLLMRISRLGRNRDAFNMIVGILGIGVGVGASLFSQRMVQISPEQMLSFINGNQSAFNALRTLFPSNIYAGNAIANNDFVAQLFNLLIVAAVFAVFMLLARILYFKGVIGISESGTPSRKMTRAEVLRDAKGQGVFGSYLQKELRQLFRSPTAFMNCVLMVFLMPVLLGVSLFSSLGSAGIDLSTLTNVDFSNPLFASYIMSGATAVGFLISGCNLTSVSCISREGQNYIFMKYVPVSYRTQLNAKAASGMLVSLMGLAATMIVLEVVFKAPPLIFIGACLLTLPGAVFMNYIGMLIDLLKPKLEWDNEQQALKQNLNVMVVLFGGMMLTAAIVIIGMLVFKTPLTAFIALFAVTGVLAVGVCQFVLHMGDKWVAKLGE